MGGEAKTVSEGCVDICGGEKEGGEEERRKEELDVQWKREEVWYYICKICHW